VATANNPTLSTEISRRCIRIRIDPRVDKPWQREGVKHPKLRTWITDHRGDLIWAALVLCRYGLQHGTVGRPLGSYESWSDVLGRILQGAGFPGFLGNLDALYDRADVEGAAWLPVGVALPGTTTVQSLLLQPNGVLTVGFNQTGAATVAGTTTLTNTGTAKTYPTLRITGPSSGTSRVYELRNTTTGRALYFSLVLNAGEMVKIVFQPDSLSFLSSFLGSVASKILAGSNEADWFLSPGSNTI
jgi:hypothetical protein